MTPEEIQHHFMLWFGHPAYCREKYRKDKTMSDDLLRRLRVANGYVAPDFATPIADPVKLEAADRISELEAERDKLRVALASMHRAALMVARDLDRSTGCAMGSANAGSLRGAVDDTSIPGLASTDEGRES